MTCKMISQHGTASLLSTLILLGTASAGRAQNTPEMRDVLARLDRIEKENLALTAELHSLRKELAALHVGTPEVARAAVAATDGQAPAPEETPPEDQQQVVENRIAELAQTRVEASQKYPIRITGMALFNAYVNGRNNNEVDNPTTASRNPGDATGGGTLRQSTLGLLFNGPAVFGGGKVSGSVYMDFFGGSTSSIGHIARLRTAGIHLDWANTSIMAGQDKPLISPRDPDSLAQVGVSPLTGAGNPWLWQPQVRVEQRFSVGNDGGLRAQLGVYQTAVLNYTGDSTYVPPAEASRPGIEGRLELWRRWGDTGRLEIAGGMHYNRNHVGPVSVPSNIYSADWFFRPMAKLEFSGMLFHGRNVATLGALRPGFTILSDGRVIPVVSNGGWAQMRIPITSRLAFNMYGGQQTNAESDILPGNISSNAAYFSNLMYRLAPNVILSMEGGQVRTNYFRVGNRLNDHYDLAIAYLF